MNYLFSYRHNKQSVFKIAANLDLLASSSLVGSWPRNYTGRNL